MSHDDLLAELLEAQAERESRDDAHDDRGPPTDVLMAARGQAAELQGLDQLETTHLDSAQAQAAATLGLAGEARDLPHLDLIQAAFGTHDVADLEAHLDGLAATATEAVGADAVVQNEAIAFAHTPDVREAAREAARAVWQREGDPGLDAEQANAMVEAIADRVAEGREAEALIDRLVNPSETQGDAWRGDGLSALELEGFGASVGLEDDLDADPGEHADLELGPLWTDALESSAALAPNLDLLVEPPLWARKKKQLGATWLFDPIAGAPPDAQLAPEPEQDFS